jgi:hypothetical protein
MNYNVNVNKYGITFSEVDKTVIIQMEVGGDIYEIKYDSYDDFKLKTKKEFDRFSEHDFFKFYKD